MPFAEVNLPENYSLFLWVGFWNLSKSSKESLRWNLGWIKGRRALKRIGRQNYRIQIKISFKAKVIDQESQRAISSSLNI